MNISEVLYQIKEHVLEQFFPFTCPFCGKLISFRDPCCGNCSKLLSPLTSVCPRCGKVKCICDRLCFVDRMYAPFLYDDIIRSAVRKMKFEQHPNYAKSMAKLVAKHVERIFTHGNLSFDCILYVPMDPKRFRQRSYNPAKLMASELGKQLHIPVLKNALKKKKTTSAQHDLSFADRQKNLQNAFLAEKDKITGKRILLCDDVITTGATMEFCSKVLKEAKAEYVFGLAFASADKKL